MPDHAPTLSTSGSIRTGQVAACAAALTTGLARQFLCERRSAGASRHVTGRALAPLLAHLRSLGVAPAAAEEIPASPTEAMLARYRGYLVSERGLKERTCRGYVALIRPFAAAQMSSGLMPGQAHLAARITRGEKRALAGWRRHRAVHRRLRHYRLCGTARPFVARAGVVLGAAGAHRVRDRIDLRRIPHGSPSCLPCPCPDLPVGLTWSRSGPRDPPGWPALRGHGSRRGSGSVGRAGCLGLVDGRGPAGEEVQRVVGWMRPSRGCQDRPGMVLPRIRSRASMAGFQRLSQFRLDPTVKLSCMLTGPSGTSAALVSWSWICCLTGARLSRLSGELQAGGQSGSVMSKAGPAV